jgi:hypothetical protein
LAREVKHGVRRRAKCVHAISRNLLVKTIVLGAALAGIVGSLYFTAPLAHAGDFIVPNEWRTHKAFEKTWQDGVNEAFAKHESFETVCPANKQCRQEIFIKGDQWRSFTSWMATPGYIDNGVRKTLCVYRNDKSACVSDSVRSGRVHSPTISGPLPTLCNIIGQIPLTSRRTRSKSSSMSSKDLAP